jgi:hypothetical protein
MITMTILQALCSFAQNGEDRLYAAWKGEIGDDRLFYSLFDGHTWSAAKTIPGNSSVGPTLAGLGEELFAGWKGEHGDDRQFWSRLSNPSSHVPWSDALVLALADSTSGPAFASLGDNLWAAWKGSGSDQTIWTATYDGAWSPIVPINDVGTSVGPSIAAMNDTVLATWIGTNNDRRIWYSTLTNNEWAVQNTIPGGVSSEGASLALYGTALYALWRGDIGDDTLYYSTWDGATWNGPTHLPTFHSSTGPAIAEYGGKLYAMWKGPVGDQSLHLASFDGAHWTELGTVPGNTGPDVPENIGLRMQFQETDDWCWITVATSIKHYYDPSSTLTQSKLLEEVAENVVVGWDAATSCTPTASTLTAHPAVKAGLANPWLKSAESILDGMIPQACMRSGNVRDALTVTGNINIVAPTIDGGTRIPLNLIRSELGAGRPIAVTIEWPNKHEHVVAISGVLDDQLLICDPYYGQSYIAYERFPDDYRHTDGGVLAKHSWLTRSS